jgi:protein tyrosine phosphatase (PTP) superfamily phosphohydrolase (DUF442 family)
LDGVLGEDRSRVRRRGRWRVARVAAIVLLIGGSLSAFFWPRFDGNFGELDPGLVYRSAQPGPGLVRLVRERELASILNLRGGSPSDSWYADEVRTARNEGVAFQDVPMSAGRRPTRDELRALLDFFDRCRYPVLIHCKSGADRTGLACALYLMAKKGVGPDEAEGAFSLSYRHIPILGPEHLHEPLQEYSAWLSARRLQHTPERFRAWVEQDYRSEPSARMSASAGSETRVK